MNTQNNLNDLGGGGLFFFLFSFLGGGYIQHKPFSNISAVSNSHILVHDIWNCHWKKKYAYKRYKVFSNVLAAKQRELRLISEGKPHSGTQLIIIT